MTPMDFVVHLILASILIVGGYQFYFWCQRNPLRPPRELRTRLDEYLRKTSDPRIDRRDPWKDYVYHQTTGYGASFNKSLPQSVRDAARAASTHKPE